MPKNKNNKQLDHKNLFEEIRKACASYRNNNKHGAIINKIESLAIEGMKRGRN